MLSPVPADPPSHLLHDHGAVGSVAGTGADPERGQVGAMAWPGWSRGLPAGARWWVGLCRGPAPAEFSRRAREAAGPWLSVPGGDGGAVLLPGAHSALPRVDLGPGLWGWRCPGRVPSPGSCSVDSELAGGWCVGGRAVPPASMAQRMRKRTPSPSCGTQGLGLQATPLPPEPRCSPPPLPLPSGTRARQQPWGETGLCIPPPDPWHGAGSPHHTAGLAPPGFRDCHDTPAGPHLHLVNQGPIKYEVG